MQLREEKAIYARTCSIPPAQVPHLMIAIRKLQYDPARYFYPMPDIEHLHTVLTMSTTNALMMMNPSLAAVASAPGMQGASCQSLSVSAPQPHSVQGESG